MVQKDTNQNNTLFGLTKKKKFKVKIVEGWKFKFGQQICLPQVSWLYMLLNKRNCAVKRCTEFLKFV